MSPRVFREVDTLLRELRSRRGFDKATVISIDGVSGSGKSHLAARVAEALGGEHVELDSFIEENCGGFFASLPFEEIKRHVDSALESGVAVVLDGALMDYVMEELTLHATRRVYVKRIRDDGDWPEGRLFVPGRTAAEVIQHAERSPGQFGLLVEKLGLHGGVLSLDQEIICYHLDRRPHCNADFVFERVG